MTADIMREEGRLTYEQFVSACLNFIKLPQAQVDSWRLEGDVYEFGESFISFSNIRRALVNKTVEGYLPLPDTNKYTESSLTDVDICTATTTPVIEGDDDSESDKRKHTDVQLLQYRFDVLYSVSHCVPVLYFIIYETTGRLLSLNEVWERCDIQGGESGSLWNVVSLQDHPVLHTPFYFVHPCNNWALLKECFQGKDEPTPLQFLMSWLSIVGNQFGLKLSPAYFQNVDKDINKTLC